MRTVLTDAEWNAFSHLTRTTGMDDSFDIAYDEDHDFFIDLEEPTDDDSYAEVSLEEGFDWLYGGIAYPCQHDGLTKEEGTLIADVLIEFGYADQEWKDWFVNTVDDEGD